MSDILIKNMEMPTSCEKCQTVLGCVDGSEGGTVWCRLAHGYIGDERTVCPLSPVLTPHGRLIDADALEDNNITYYAIPVLANVTDGTIREAELVIRLKDLDDAPTIIPAEEGEI